MVNGYWLTKGRWLERVGLFIETAKKHIEGEVSIDDVDALISTYYLSETAREIPEDMKEADEVSKNIVRILSEHSFSFSVQGLAGLHRRISKGVMKHAGDFRQYNITKKEWVLDGKQCFMAHLRIWRGPLNTILNKNENSVIRD